MPAVLDWRTRTARTVRYLSFLPMSHVVEGILVAYAPYYILANIEMYYLNDFSALAEALPRVRPNLFFSVPRFYEKVWNQFAATRMGEMWIGLPDGPAKRALARPLRYAVLRRAVLPCLHERGAGGWSPFRIVASMSCWSIDEEG